MTGLRVILRKIFSKRRKMKKRDSWIDQARGLAMFLVVYGHNFPNMEKYIYSFHMPLFLCISGFFLTSFIDFSDIKERFVKIMIPYFIWSLVLFTFWIFLGKNFGESSKLNLSVLKNFEGIFYAQGGQRYMDWGIPMWFLPNIFMAYIFYYLSIRISSKYSVFMILIFSMIGFLYSKIIHIPLPWSINVASISALFLLIGNRIYPILKSINKKYALIIMFITFCINYLFFDLNIKIDMYRSIFGTEFLFLLNGISGSIFILCFFKVFPHFKFLEILGKFTIVLLALQLLAMTIIKGFLYFILDIKVFEFNELEKFYFAIIQVILILPIGLIVNKYFPLLNGGYKKL